MENIIRPSLALIARYFFHVTKGDVVVEDEEQEFELEQIPFEFTHNPRA
jgi:hypothetical protein